MNKFISMILFAVFLIVSGIVYQEYYRPEGVGPVTATGNVVEINMRSLENRWRFEPNVITARVGDRVILKIFNEDTYDHGFALEAFGINRRLFPRRETVIDFVVTKAGVFSFYCSVPCGEGHYQHVGQFAGTEEQDDTSAEACTPGGHCHKLLHGTLVVHPRG